MRKFNCMEINIYCELIEYYFMFFLVSDKISFKTYREKYSVYYIIFKNTLYKCTKREKIFVSCYPKFF